ncbi:MAG: hypothetical protein WCL50_01255 [Spirochaetota bacterium]
MTKALLVGLMAVLGMAVQAQEALLSAEERYYDFLALEGRVERPYLNYRTLSDSRWALVEGEGLWRGNNKGRVQSLTESLSLRIYGPTVFSSYNSAEPFGQNDAALWQGRGLNSSLDAGLRLEGYGFELTFKPQLTFSQNQAFDLMPSGYESPYGYIWAGFVDAPQRFGDKPLFGYSWGDSELRYAWRNLTIGFGTQEPWIGPGRINAILHSNNAPPYPKLDLGLRKSRLDVFGLNFGEVEGRLWGGYLSESAFFDSEPSNDHNLISGIALAYAPSLVKGLTLFANRTYLSKWQPDSVNTFASLLFFKFNADGAGDKWDQRVSIGYDFLLPDAGFETYGEAGINDNPGPNFDSYERNFSHTVVYTGGLRKRFPLDFAGNELDGQLTFEWSNLEMSPAYSQFLWANTFYMHGQITQGYTNEGQWLGVGTGTGGNSQYMGLDVYHARGSVTLYAHRYNPDNDFVMRFTTPSAGSPANDIYDKRFKAVLAVGVQSHTYIASSFSVDAGVAWIRIDDPLYATGGAWYDSDIVNGFRIELGCAYHQ